MQENLLKVANGVFEPVIELSIIMLLIIMVIEHKSIRVFFKNKKKKIKDLYPFFKRLAYLIGGIALMLYSFAIVNTLLEILTPTSMPYPDNTTVEVKGFWSTWKHYSNFTGLFAVIGLTTAGLTLIVSAGTRWMVNLAKIISTATILYLFFSIFVVYA
ncbi:hypothetical protein CL656_04035 [bacterium]|nr:hypothetical protein [bacterium]|tara:strand:- start:88 stop:561 length:474 start_codon:yes stop_codon:yes gene_type:complete